MADASRHAVIAGTGRAGATFLVEFLGACGLDVGPAGEDGANFDRPNAGRETALDHAGDLPYVVKDTRLFAYCRSLDLTRISIDVLIVPMRDLWQSAASRCHQERVRMVETGGQHRVSAWTAGGAPGGAIYSVEVADQANVLARGLHELLYWAAEQQIPVLMPAFPRLITDADYLLSTLWPWLRDHCSEEEARRAFAATARPEDVSQYPVPKAGDDPRTIRAEAHARALAARLDELQASPPEHDG